MIYNEHGNAMSLSDAEDIAAWFIRHMSMEQRIKFMAERPLIYARMFPEVGSGVIAERVTESIETDGRR